MKELNSWKKLGHHRMDNGDTIGSTRTPTAPFSVTTADERNRMIGESSHRDSD
jgi:hypothetical protein